MENTDLPTSDVLLDLWLDQSSAADFVPIGLKGEPSYRYFWRTWTKFLAKTDPQNNRLPIPWHEVRREHIVSFLANGVRERKSGAGVSIITKRRYWRLLERVYGFAVDNGWIESNPASGLAKAEKPPSENPSGAIMLPPLWNAARNALMQPIDETAGPLEARNRALLLVLFEFGLTPAELRCLSVSAILPITEGAHGWLVVDGPEVKHRRKFLLPSHVSDALAHWVDVRAKSGAHGKTTSLFSSRRGGAMTDENLLALVRSHILAAAAALMLQPPPRLGPQIVRNSRLVMWLNNGIPAGEVAVRAGLKNIKGLYHLREHLLPEIRLTVRNQRDEPLIRMAA